MNTNDNLVKKNFKKVLNEALNYIDTENIENFKKKYGIIDEGNIVSEDDLITDEKLVNLHNKED